MLFGQRRPERVIGNRYGSGKWFASTNVYIAIPLHFTFRKRGNLSVARTATFNIIYSTYHLRVFSSELQDTMTEHSDIKIYVCSKILLMQPNTDEWYIEKKGCKYWSKRLELSCISLCSLLLFLSYSSYYLTNFFGAYPEDLVEEQNLSSSCSKIAEC